MFIFKTFCQKCPRRAFGAAMVLLISFSLNALGENDLTADPSADSSLFSAVRLTEPLDFCGEAVALDNPNIREELEKELMLAMWNRPQVVLWIKRSGRYLPYIESLLKFNGMPDDLKYIPFVESAMKPHAGSSKGAMGYWQFMPATGKKYNLQVDRAMDERRNFRKSTSAALQYLKELHQMFGSWTLSAAAYNMGEQGLKSEILIQKNSNFYDLYLPLETQQYIFKILAVKLILTHPEKYGFVFGKEDLYPPRICDNIDFSCSVEIPLTLVAEALGTSFKTLKDLNPEIRGHYLSAGSHQMDVPQGSGKDFPTRFSRLVQEYGNQKNNRVYIVKKGDNLSSIAERFNVPLPALMIWNRLDSKRAIHPGDRLIVYPDIKPVQ